MSRTAVIVALAVLVLLSAALVAVSWKPAGRTPSGDVPRLVDFGEDGLERIEVSGAGGALVVSRGPMPDLWVMRDGSSDGAVWPVPASRVRGLMRLLGEAGVSAAAEPAGDAAVTATFRLADGTARVLGVHGSPVGGRSTAVVEWAGGRGAVSASHEVLRLLDRDAMLEWRSAAALPAGSAGASRVVVAPGGSAGLTLGRVGARWALQAPFAAPADAEAAGSVLRALDEVLIVRFRERTAGAGSGASVTVEADQQQADGERLVRRRLVQRVEVVGPSGPETVIVRCTGELHDASGASTPLWEFWGDARSEALAKVPSAPAALVSRVASGVPRADVAGLSWSVGEGGASFRRELEAWSRRGPGGEVPATPEEVSGLQRVLELLTAARADRVLDAGVPFEPAVRVTLEDLRGDPLEMVDLALLASAEGEAAVAARTSGLVRVYGGPAARPIFDWLVEHARAEAR